MAGEDRQLAVRTALGMPALAITDFTNLLRSGEVLRSGHGAGIKPIVGAEFCRRANELLEMSHPSDGTGYYGYQNLTLLIRKRISAATARQA